MIRNVYTNDSNMNNSVIISFINNLELFHLNFDKIWNNFCLCEFMNVEERNADFYYFDEKKNSLIMFFKKVNNVSKLFNGVLKFYSTRNHLFYSVFDFFKDVSLLFNYGKYYEYFERIVELVSSGVSSNNSADFLRIYLSEKFLLNTLEIYSSVNRIFVKHLLPYIFVLLDAYFLEKIDKKQYVFLIYEVSKFYFYKKYFKLSFYHDVFIDFDCSDGYFYSVRYCYLLYDFLIKVLGMCNIDICDYIAITYFVCERIFNILNARLKSVALLAYNNNEVAVGFVGNTL